MYDRILVPTDGSDVARAAAETAVELARRFDAELHAVHVRERGRHPSGAASGDPDQRSDRGGEAVRGIESLAAEAGVEAAGTVVEGGVPTPVHRTLLDYADEHDVDCVVMGTHGYTGWDRFVLGSVAERTLRESPVPVVTVHGDAALAPGADVERILVPTDGSDCSEVAVDHAAQFAAGTGATLHAINAVDLRVAAAGNAAVVLDRLEESGRRLLEETASAARAAAPAGSLDVETELVRGSPQRSIVDYADERDVDCIVMGTHGRTGIGRYLLGSVAERVVRLAEVPVITLGAPESGG